MTRPRAPHGHEITSVEVCTGRLRTLIDGQLAGSAKMVEFRQGFRSMAAPTRELEKLIVSEKLAHGGNPVTRWMAANAAVAQDPAGNLKPAKDKSTERIDGIVAIIMALGRAMVIQEEPQPSYEMFIL